MSRWPGKCRSAIFHFRFLYLKSLSFTTAPLRSFIRCHPVYRPIPRPVPETAIVEGITLGSAYLFSIATLLIHLTSGGCHICPIAHTKTSVQSWNLPPSASATFILSASNSCAYHEGSWSILLACVHIYLCCPSVETHREPLVLYCMKCNVSNSANVLGSFPGLLIGILIIPFHSQYFSVNLLFSDSIFKEQRSDPRAWREGSVVPSNSGKEYIQGVRKQPW